ncbi:MAG: hypothetical protein ACOX74_01625 [Lachnospiraceae bacterium]
MENSSIGRAERILSVLIQIIIMAMLAVLIFLSATGTCAVYGYNEHVQYLHDTPALHLCCAAAVLMIAVFAAKRGTAQKAEQLRASKRKHAVRPELITAAAVFAAGILWLIFVPGKLEADAQRCYRCAKLWLAGNYEPWKHTAFCYGGTEEGYAYTYPSQNGLILYMIGLIRLFGSKYASTAFRVINLAALLAGTWALTVFLKETRAVRTALVCFLPFSFYFLFVYGTMPGFALSMLALLAAQRFVSSGKWRHAILSSVLIACAAQIKSNYLIVCVALLLYLIGEAIIRKKPRLLLCVLLCIAAVWAGGRAVTAFFETSTGYSEGGIPKIAWVEMGLQKGPRANGWYNGYQVDTFQENGGDPDKTEAVVRSDLQKTLQKFRSDPSYAWKFFIRKTQSQWTEPTFESLWIQKTADDETRGNAFTASLMEQGGRLNSIYLAVTDILQSLVYEGAFLYFLLDFGGRCRRRRGGELWESLVPAVIFIGGFLFHFLWEAKTQYTVVYFLLLIPYAWRGFAAAGTAAAAYIKKRK